MYQFHELKKIYRCSDFYDWKNTERNLIMKLRFMYGFTQSIHQSKEVIESVHNIKIANVIEKKASGTLYYGEKFNI